MARVRVIGCGNPDVGDDAAGILAVAGAREALEALPGVEVIPEASPLHVVDLLRGADAAVVVDAMRSPGGERPPGTIVRVEVGPDGLPAEVRSAISSHGIGIADAFGLAAALGAAARAVVLGVEAGSATAGAPLSPAVRAALPELTRRIVQETRVLLGEAERSASDGSTGPTPAAERTTG